MAICHAGCAVPADVNRRHRRLLTLCVAVSIGASFSAQRVPAQFDPVIAYEIPAGTGGNQEFGGSLGMDFDVQVDITITHLGVFDSDSDGIRSPITARLFDRDTLQELAALEFTPDEPGELMGGSRFKGLAAALEISGGSHLTISAEGYSGLERNGNQGFAPLGLITHDGNCSIVLVGSGRYGDAGSFPANRDFFAGPSDRYAAGTLIFVPRQANSPHGAIPYVVPAGAVGNQDFGGELGMDFDVNSAVIVTRLGVFDDGSDGLHRTITARLWDRDALSQLASLEFSPDDPGDLLGGSRFKPLDAPLALGAGFHGVLSASGYGAREQNGNVGWPGLELGVDEGGCVLDLVGQSRYSLIAGAFPETVDFGPFNRYAAGTFEFEIEAPPPPEAEFRRSDVDQDGQHGITDAVQIFSYLFLDAQTRVPDCMDAADADDNGQLQLTDGVWILAYVFLGLTPPAPPFDACGVDPTPLDTPGCKSFDGCP